MGRVSGAECDYGHEAAGGGALFAVGEEKVGVAGSAEVDGMDVWGAEVGGHELRAVGFAEVEEDAFGRGLVAGRHHVEPLDGIGLVAGAEFVEVGGGVRELRKELGGDFGADFVAAGADAGADSGEEVARVGAEVHLHFADGLGGDAGEGAAPAGVNGGDGAFLGVNEEDGDTVGGLDGEEEAGAIGDAGVATARIGRGPRLVEEVDYVGVELLQGD